MRKIQKYWLGMLTMACLYLCTTVSMISCKQSPEAATQQPGAIAHQPEPEAGTASPDSVLAWLTQGNQQFIDGVFNEQGVDSTLRIRLSKGQHPKAVVLCCSDSRVAPELIFDKGLGDLFVIRVAGNIEDDAVLGSIEYAVEHLHTPLVVVMGHKNCGAIAAAVGDLQEGGKDKIDNHIRALTDRIEEAMLTTDVKATDTVEKALLSNVIFTVRALRVERPVLYEAVKAGHLKVVGAVYDVATGKVNWMDY